MQTQFVILLITPDLMDHIYIRPNVNYEETQHQELIIMIDLIDIIHETVRPTVVFYWFVVAPHPGWFSKGWCLTSCLSSNLQADVLCGEVCWSDILYFV